MINEPNGLNSKSDVRLNLWKYGDTRLSRPTRFQCSVHMTALMVYHWCPRSLWHKSARALLERPMPPFSSRVVGGATRQATLDMSIRAAAVRLKPTLELAAGKSRSRGAWEDVGACAPECEACLEIPIPCGHPA
eukprot:7238367-Pyramimonas_sp.AAC.1